MYVYRIYACIPKLHSIFKRLDKAIPKHSKSFPLFPIILPSTYSPPVKELGIVAETFKVY